jgi:NADPH:quinone reductase-like Zn-dependent oxidoreductase
VDLVIDYTAGDPLAQAEALAPFSVIVDCVGELPASRLRALLAPGGRHVMVAADTPRKMTQVLAPPFTSRAILGKPTTTTLEPLVEGVASGQLTVSILDRLPLSSAEEAQARSRSGRLTGKLILVP